ncbi:hypothetical protein KJ784_03130 [Patescibacteria group bacterium]|nr:hypothetical protein [Patescibacteria group bacterium]
MDIKQNKPSLSQEANSTLNPKSGFSDSPSLMTQFVIRTMAGDLKTAASQPAAKMTDAKTSPPTPPRAVPRATPRGEQSELYAAAPRDDKFYGGEQSELYGAAPGLPAKAAARITKENLIQTQETQEKELRDILIQAKFKIAAKEFDGVIVDAQKIIDNPAAGWLAKWRAKRLIKKAQKGIDEKTNEPMIVIPLSAPAKIIPPKPAPAPRGDSPKGEELYAATPVNLPITEDRLSTQPTPSRPMPSPSPTPTPPLPPTPKPATPETFIPPPTPPAAAPRDDKFYGGEQSEPYGSAPRDNQLDTTEPKEVLDMKKITLVGLSSIAILALIIGGLWYFLKQPASPAQISPSLSPRPSLATQTPSPTPTPAPTPLFKADSQKIFELKTGQEKANFQEAIAQLSQTDEPAGSFIYSLFKDSREQFPSLAKIASSTEIDLFDLPTQINAGSLKNQLAMNRFSFFVYSQGQSDSSPFISELNSGRWGLIIEVQNIASTSIDDLAKSLKDLEQLTLAGLKILLPDAKNNLPAKPIWLDNVYRGIQIRYVNLPEPDLSLDYAIVNSQLIFATSKASMHAIIDRVLPPITNSSGIAPITP